MPELSLERRFDDAMHELYGRIVREAGGYTPNVFFRMIEQHSGLEAAHRLLRPDADFFSYGFDHLSQMRQSDLTMEALILSLQYKDQLFNPKGIGDRRGTAAGSAAAVPTAHLTLSFVGGF